jgi:hypothetical protein
MLITQVRDQRDSGQGSIDPMSADAFAESLPEDLRAKIRKVAARNETPLAFIARTGLALSQIASMSVDEIRKWLERSERAAEEARRPQFVPAGQSDRINENWIPKTL